MTLTNQKLKKKEEEEEHSMKSMMSGDYTLFYVLLESDKDRSQIS